MRRLLFLLLLFAVPVFAQSPCDGRITDKLAHPMDPAGVSKPAPGECYTDPAFGTKVCRISAADPAEGPNAVIKTNYNTTRGWNADGSRLYSWHRGGRIYEIYEGDEPYAHVQTLTLGGSATTGNPTDIEHVLWDPIDPNVLYYPSNYSWSGGSVPKLYKVTLDPSGGPETQELLRDFSVTEPGCAHSAALSLGHVHDMSISANRMIGLSCGSDAAMIGFLYSIAEDQVYGVRTGGLGGTPVALQSGTGAYFQSTGQVVDVNFNHVRTIPFVNPFEHQSLGLAGGIGSKDSLNRVNFDEPQNGSLVSYDLATGISTVIVGVANGWGYPPSGTHPTLAAQNGSGWVAVSSSGSLPIGQAVLHGELYLGNILTGEVCRIAHTRTHAKLGVWGYWGEAHPQISADGYRVLFGSDWLGSETIDTYVVDLRGSDLPPPSGPTYEALVSWEDNSDNEDGFRIERASTTAGPFVPVGAVSANMTAFVNAPIAEGETWCYRPIAYNGGGDASPPPLAACDTAEPTDQPPTPATGVSVVITER